MKVNYRKSGDRSVIIVDEALSSIEYYRVILEVFQTLYLKRKYRLSEKESYFAACVLYFISKGIRDIENDADFDILNKFGFKDKHTVQVWRKKLAKKFWIKYLNKEYYFTEKIIEDYCDVGEANFSISLRNMEDEISRRDNI